VYVPRCRINTYHSWMMLIMWLAIRICEVKYIGNLSQHLYIHDGGRHIRINLQIHQQHNIYIVWSLTLFRHTEHFWCWSQKRVNLSQSTEIFVHYKVLRATDSLRLTSGINCLPHNIRTIDLKLFVIKCSKSINVTLCWR
jgi:hypothetical protein